MLSFTPSTLINVRPLRMTITTTEWPVVVSNHADTEPRYNAIACELADMDAMRLT